MYAKLFASILDSSLWASDVKTRILFVTMMAMADQEGYVFATKSGLSRRAVLTPEDTEEALATLLSPDDDSSDKTRSPEHEGRRVEPIDGGWRLLNYSFYRSLKDSDERRQQNKEAKRRERAKKKASASVIKSHQCQPSEAEASHLSVETNTNTGEAASRPTAPKKKPESLAEVEAFWLAERLYGDPAAFWEYRENHSWKWKSWQADAKNWARRDFARVKQFAPRNLGPSTPSRYADVKERKISNEG